MMLVFLISSIISSDTTKETTIIHSDSEKDFSIISSDYWEISSQIIIDDSSPGSNWAFTNATYSWCNGAGTWEDPYIIENVTINPGSGSAITVENSNVYFIIKNCTIRNTGGSSEDAGIKLINVNNSRILGNKFFDIDRFGIYLKNSCINNTISDNYLFEDYPYISYYMREGIYLYDQCNNNTIENNKLHGIGRFSSVDRAGIHLKNNCSYNKIENNQVNRSMHGIFLNADCNENTLFNNSLISNDGNGIYISTSCDSNAILNNTVYDNDDGIYIEVSCNINIVANNTVYNNDDNGIYFVNGCEYNVILNNIIYQNDVGIKVETDIQFCKDYTIAGNILNNNLLYGIYLDAVIKVNLSENALYGCGFLIDSNNINHHRSISLSTNNTVNGKPVYYVVEESGLDSSDFPNAGQIILIDCNNTNLANFNFSFCSIGLYIYSAFYWGGGSYNHTISNITLQENTIGLYVERIHNISISNVTAKKNGAGIYLGECNNCSIDNCTLNENSNYGLDMWECTFNNITNNYIQFNRGYGAGFYLGGCEFNKIINNTISNNAENGIFFNGGKNNYICGNNISYNNKSGIYLTCFKRSSIL